MIHSLQCLLKDTTYMARKKRKGTPVVDGDDEVEDIVEEDENDEDDEEEEDDEDDEDDEEVNATVAVGAFRQVAHFFRPYFAPYRTSLLLLALGVAIE